MLAEETLNNKIKKLWPKDGPPLKEIEKYIKKYSKEKIVIKCGGRVLLDPNRTIGYQQELRWNFDTGETTGLLIRNDVAVPTGGKDSNLSIYLSVETWANLLAGKVTLSDSLTSGMITTENTTEQITLFFSHFDLPTFTQ